MTKEELLTKLKDVHMPSAISMWPNTLPWYFIFIISGVFLIVLIVLLGKVFFKIRLQKKVLHLLNLAVSKYEMEPNTALIEISILVKRVALSKFSRKQVAGLKGSAWLYFLDHSLNTNEFSNGIGKVLATAPYQKKPEINIIDLKNLITRWIKRVL